MAGIHTPNNESVVGITSGFQSESGSRDGHFRSGAARPEMLPAPAGGGVRVKTPGAGAHEASAAAMASAHAHTRHASRAE